MKKFFLWGGKLFMGMLLLVLTGGSVSAIELNSGNVSTLCRTGYYAGDTFNTYVLNCFDPTIDSIAPNTFLSGYTDKTVLLFRGSLITSIESGDLAGLSNLQEISFDRNSSLKSFRSLDFSGLPNLKKLVLDNIDSLTGIEEGDFVGLSNLEELDLSYNDSLLSIEEGDFSGLPNLKKLTVDRNNALMIIGSGAFSGLSNLKKLAIEVNLSLTGIKSGIFAGLSGLTGLYLNANNIESIESGVFVGLSNIEQLTLNYNDLSILEPSLFSGLSALKGLGLEDNPIASLELGVFSGLSNLQILNIANLDLTGIQLGIFSGLSNLQTLELHDNKISSIESGAFVGLGALKELSLYRNSITSIEMGDFLGLGSLSYLGLDYNLISRIQNGSLAHLISGDTALRLGDNYLTVLPSELLSYSGFRLNLGNNCLDFDLLTQEQINYLDTKKRGRPEWTTSQKVCSAVEYSLSTETTGSVVGSIIFAGGVSGQRDELYMLNPTITGLTHTWTENGTFGFDLSTLVNTGSYLKSLPILTGNVTWIIPYVAPTQPTVGFAGGGAGGGSSIPNTSTTPTTPTTPITPTTPTTPTDTEQVNAYKRAYNAGVTTQPTVGEARLESTISRGELAKMLSVYATEQLKKTPDTNKVCTYADANTTSEELAGYMKTVCQLEIMGLQGDGKMPLEVFNPNETVTRAQLVTTISRLLYGNKYDTNGENRWSGHMNILKTEGIVTITDPNIVELRGWVMLMLYRLQ